MQKFETSAPIAVVLDVAAGRVQLIAADRADVVVEVRPVDASKGRDVRAAEQTVVEFAGGVLHDDELVEAARLERARVSELKKAAELETVAAATRERADAALGEERSRAEAQRERIARETAAREAALEREEAHKREQVNAAAEQREESVRETEARTKEQLAKQKRAARKARLQAEQEVLQDEHRAVAAQGAAVDADRQLRATKAARRSNRRDT